jgi:hypothetical protein
VGGDRKAYPLRVDPALWAAVERLAQAELRSVNGQVEYLLRDALARRGIRTTGAQGIEGASPRHRHGNGSPITSERT